MSKLVFRASILAVSIVTLVTYFPATRIGFVNNDWIYLDRVVRWDLPQYLYHYLVPGAESGWYRPIFGIYFWLVYSVFGASPVAYHTAYIVLHLLNGLLVFGLVKRIADSLPVAAIAALLYVGFPSYSKAVYWPSTPDTLETFFYLGAIWLWFEFLQEGKRRFWLFTFVAFLLALMTKETSMTLPVVLFLIDRMLGQDSTSRQTLIRRYAPFLIVWIPYLVMEYSLQKSGSYVSLAGYGFGIHMFWNLLNSLAALVFPWRSDFPLSFVLVGLAVVIVLSATLAKKSMGLALLGIFIVLNLVPVIGFPTQWFDLRYLYEVAIASAIIFAVGFVWVLARLPQSKVFVLLASVLIAVALIANGTGTAQAISDWGEIARQRAVPFRDIQRSHPTFPGPTRLYFVDSSITPVYDLSVMFLLRYGSSVVVDGTDDNWPNRVANLRQAPNSYVYYFDTTGKPIEVPVAQNAVTSAAPRLPVTFNPPIQLEGYEVTTNSPQRGEALVLFLYWRAEQKINEDYTVFVHLVDDLGTTIASHDSQPHAAKNPTSTWEPGEDIVDPVILEIPQGAPVGSGYRLEVGMYTRATGERLAVLDSNGQRIDDKISIGSVQVAE